MKDKITVVFHSADYDGLFCREIARKFLPDAELIGWDFGNPPLVIPAEGQIYVMDLPVDRVFGFDFSNMGISAETKWPDVISISQPESQIRAFLESVKRVIWIDHHRSSIATHPDSIPGYRIDGVSACRLAWAWFDANHHAEDPEKTTAGLPDKQAFLDRKVSEPYAVTLAGEYDIWDHAKSDSDDVAFQFGLDSYEKLRWDWLLSVRPNDPDPDGYCQRIVDAGKGSMQCYAKRDGEVMRERSFLVDFEGLKFLALNTPRCNSQTFAVRDIPETGHDALMAFYFTGKGWSVSLYHAGHRKDLDLSQIASSFGGGGHRGACGFRSDKLPFLKND